jgi:hypothetical protein
MPRPAAEEPVGHIKAKIVSVAVQELVERRLVDA